MVVTDVIKEGNKLYYLSASFAGLFSYDLISGETTFLCRFEGYGLFDKFICTHMVLHKRNIIIAPGYGDTFYSYNIDCKDLHAVTFEDGLYSTHDKGINEKFSFHCIIDDDVFFVGYNSLQIVKINSEGTKGRVVLLKIPKEINGVNVSRLAIEGIVEDKTIFIPFIDVPKVLRFNIINEQIEILDCRVDFKMLGMGSFEKHKYIYSLSEIRIVEVYFNEKKECVCELLDVHGELNKVLAMRNICRSVVLKNGLFVIPFRGNQIIKIDTKNKYLQSECDVSEFSGERTFLTAGKLDEKSFWGYSEEKDALMIYDAVEENYIRYLIPLFKIEGIIGERDVKALFLHESVAEVKLEDFMKII